MSRVSRHVLRRRVNFYEVDSAGIVHFSWFYRYMEEAEIALWRSAGLRVTPSHELAFPRVAAAFDFRAPLRFDDEFDAEIEVASMGRSSIGYVCRIARDGTPLATGTMTIVCVKPGDPMRAVQIPPEVMERLEIAEERRT